MFSACEQSVGFGQVIDFEAPTLTVTSIVLPDGTEMPILEDDNKLIIGPGILFGPECFLKGEAQDNILITGIQVEETGPNAEIINGKTRVWNNAEISPRGLNGKQTWIIALDGIQKGERNITISAFDSPKNIGSNMMQSLTLLVDTDPPFVENVEIERSPGVYVELLSKNSLENLDPNELEYVDYFQNKSFIIRASIKHDFKLEEVSLNFLNEEGTTVFSADIAPSSGGLTTPMWQITEEMLVDADPSYSTGRHYLQASINAKAEAGHSGQNDVSNLLYNLCWYPEADNARIRVDIPAKNGVIPSERSSNIPMTVFDDDTVKEVYAAMISEADWNAFISPSGIPESSEDEKLESLYDDAVRNNFFYSSDIKNNRISAAVRNTTFPLISASERGEYRLIVLVLDTEGCWTHELFTVQVMEDGIPVINISEPAENTSPALSSNGNFTLAGTVMNLDEVEFLRIAWIPDGLGWNANEQIEKGQEALKNNLPASDIQIWDDIALSTIEDRTIGNKVFKQQSFEKTFNIFSDFNYNGNRENKQKLFILYTQGTDGFDVFVSFRLMPYINAPKITMTPPDGAAFGKNDTIEFEIRIDPENGIPIKPETVTLISVTDNNKNISLERGSGDNENVWTGTTAFANEGSYSFQANVEDELENKNKLEQYVIVTTLPEFVEITSPHADATTFSGRGTVRLQAVFSGAISDVLSDPENSDNKPRLKLEGFTDGQPRYANYTDGKGSATLNFAYTIQAGDETVAGGITVSAVDLNGGNISSEDDLETISASQLNPNKRFYVDGVAPKINSIAMIGNGENAAWLRAGQDLTIRLISSKPMKVLGSPKLNLSFNNRSADFQYLENEDKTMVFTYKVQGATDAALGDNTNSVNLAAMCFSAADLAMITDKAGNQGNILSLAGMPALIGNIAIDTAEPAKLILTDISDTAGIPPFKFRIDGTIDSNATVEYTTNGFDWEEMDSPYPIPEIDDPGTFNVAVRQTDPAGNRTESAVTTVTVSEKSNLSAIISDNPDGYYVTGDKLSFRLLFDGKVKALSGNAGPSITIGREETNTGDVTLTLASDVTAVTNNDGDFVLPFAWTVPAGIDWSPLKIKAISLASVQRADKTAPGGNIAIVLNDYNNSRKVEVLSIIPVINGIKTGNGETVSQYANADAAVALEAATISALDNETLILSFGHDVLPEQGTITIKPAGNWLLPPVLSSDEYFEITKNLVDNLDDDDDDFSKMEKAYIKTTHGLINNGTSYIPDTATKYVLKFEYGLDNDTNDVYADIRNIFDKAGYLQQGIDVHANQVEVDGSTVTVKVNNLAYLPNGKLPDGRIWDISINAGAFIDAAGNLSLPLNTVIWSGKTAVPVIRVNRTSNNHFDGIIADVTALPPSTTNIRGVSGTKVQYRIDCVTPGAVISYAEILNAYVANIPAGGAAGNSDSSIQDIPAGTLESAGIANSYIAGTNFRTIGDNSLYTARKDYIAANAKRSNLGPSDRGYEGVFKTVVVYRDLNVNDYIIKFEGSNVNGGVPSIAGFPLRINDYRTSKYAYKNDTNPKDYIWITWEIVSDFYQNGVKIENDNWAQYQNPIWIGDSKLFTSRTYGNYGLLVGNGF
jgi:hypothetical protein